jgi:hypothetical protein
MCPSTFTRLSITGGYISGSCIFPKFSARVSHFSVITPFVFTAIHFSNPSVLACCHVAQSTAAPIGVSSRNPSLVFFVWRSELSWLCHIESNNTPFDEECF